MLSEPSIAVSRVWVPDLTRQAAALLLLLGAQTNNPIPAGEARMGPDEARGHAHDGDNLYGTSL
jgi:hypothetical protein